MSTSKDIGRQFDGTAKDGVLQRFSMTQPDRPHTLEDTIRYASLQKSHGAESVAEYLTAFATRSSLMRELDASCPLMLRTGSKPTFPDAVINLARAIPADPDGRETTRLKFIVDHLTASRTFQHHVEHHSYDKLPAAIAREPSIVWVVQRAFRSLQPDAQKSLVFDLGNKLPDHGVVHMANMLQDFHAAPKDLRATEPA